MSQITAPEQWTVKKMLSWTTTHFRQRNIPSARLDAELLLGALLGLSRIELYTHFDRPLDQQELTRFKQWVVRRRNGENTAYIIGTKEFWSLTFNVNKAVLVPRPETETIIQAVINLSPPPKRILDMCCGSGCIGITLATLFPEAEVALADLSAAALAVARQNGHKHQVLDRCTFFEGDLFSALDDDHAPFDLLVTNPPYVAGELISQLAPEVQQEPVMALDGGGSAGLDIITRLLASCRPHLTDDARILMEIGYDQGEPVTRQLGPNHLGHNGRVLKDLSGLDRVAFFDLGSTDQS